MKIGIDLDGTLLNCRPRQSMLLTTLCRACALDVDADQYWHLKRQGYSNRKALRHLGADEDGTETVAALWEHAIEDLFWLRFDRIIPGVTEILCRWRQTGHELHLLSARRNHANAHQQLRLLGLNVFTSVDFVNPFDARAKESALLRLNPGIYIGDTERDARCAQAAGVAATLVSSGLRSRKYLQQNGDWPVVDQLSDVHLPDPRQAVQ